MCDWCFCYSNQQTEWAFTLGEELLSYYNSIWSYLLGNTMDFSLLNISTVKLIKSCNAFLSLGTLFTETVTAESLTGLTAIFEGLGIESLSAIGGYVILPLVLFLNIGGAGEDDGYVDNYWDFHISSQHPELTPIYGDVVQIKKKKDLTYESDYENYVNIANDLGFYHWGLAVPSGGDEGNKSSLKIFITLFVASFSWSTYYIGSYIMKGLNTKHDIINIELKFNNMTNKTEILMIYDR